MNVYNIFRSNIYVYHINGHNTGLETSEDFPYDIILRHFIGNEWS